VALPLASSSRLYNPTTNYCDFHSNNRPKVRRLAHVSASLDVRDDASDAVFGSVPAETTRDDALTGAACVAGDHNVGVCLDYAGFSLDVEFVLGGFALGFLLQQPVKHLFFLEVAF
jgi:hypothetical protein